MPTKPSHCNVMVAPGLLPGWICGAYRGYNGLWRSACRDCGHTRCELRRLVPSEVESLWSVYAPNRAPCRSCGPGLPTGDADLQTGPRMLGDGLHHPRCVAVAS